MNSDPFKRVIGARTAPESDNRTSDLEELLRDFHARLDLINEDLKRRRRFEVLGNLGCSFVGYLLAMLVIKAMS